MLFFVWLSGCRCSQFIKHPKREVDSPERIPYLRANSFFFSLDKTTNRWDNAFITNKKLAKCYNWCDPECHTRVHTGLNCTEKKNANKGRKSLNNYCVLYNIFGTRKENGLDLTANGWLFLCSLTDLLLSLHTIYIYSVMKKSNRKGTLQV